MGRTLQDLSQGRVLKAPTPHGMAWLTRPSSSLQIYQPLRLSLLSEATSQVISSGAPLSSSVSPHQPQSATIHRRSTQLHNTTTTSCNTQLNRTQQKVCAIPHDTISHTTTPQNTIQHNTTQHNTTQHNTTQHNTTQHNTTQHNTTQHNTTQHSTAQHSTAQHSTAQHNTTQHNTTQHNTTQHNTTQHNTTQHNTTQHNTTQHNTTQHNTTQHNTTQHNTTQHNTTQHNTTQHNTTQHNTTQHNTTRQCTVPPCQIKPQRAKSTVGLSSMTILRGCKRDTKDRSVVLLNCEIVTCFLRPTHAHTTSRRICCSHPILTSSSGPHWTWGPAYPAIPGDPIHQQQHMWIQIGCVGRA